MIMLTDGRDMKNFDQVGNASWRIAERAIAADRGTGFLVTKDSYGDFKIRAEFWADEGTNSGIFIRCDNPQAPSAASCYEINIFDANPNRGNATGAIVNVTKVDPVPQTLYKWNVIEIEAKGPQLNVTINGERTSSAQDTKHARGRIALQYASGVIYFRKVEFRPLRQTISPKKPARFMPIARPGSASSSPVSPWRGTPPLRQAPERPSLRGNITSKRAAIAIPSPSPICRTGPMPTASSSRKHWPSLAKRGRCAPAPMSSWDWAGRAASSISSNRTAASFAPPPTRPSIASPSRRRKPLRETPRPCCSSNRSCS